ncbi:hypothetical protein [Amycolatopsis sp. CA-128772]|uniref:hypothetical protein n=1 Tax=Amycolatopsis sp. CA-128772 TaxID=2073159 RepID=UPI000CD19C60|nr:hypothetical protein [Amycolatopsis sp. CA-128772]
MPDNTQPHALPADVLRVDERLVCGDDQPYFPAQLGEPTFAADGADGRRHYTVTPRFRRLVTEWIAITVEATSDHLRFRWDGDDLIVTDDDALHDDTDPTRGPAIERLHPDADGRYLFQTWLWHEHDTDTKRLDDTTRTALAVLATDDSIHVDTVIRYIIENTYPAPDPQTLRTIRTQHRTLTGSPTAPVDATESEETHDE